jgi:hypothetical protein
MRPDVGPLLTIADPSEGRNITRTLDSGCENVTVAAIPLSPSAGVSISVGGKSLTSPLLQLGAPGSVIHLKIRVTAQDGTVAVFGLNVLRAMVGASNNTHLSSLVIQVQGQAQQLQLSPSFDSATSEYQAAALNGVTGVVLSGVASDSGAQAVGLRTWPLDVGANYLSVQVTAADGSSVLTYYLVITRAASSDTHLSSLHLYPGGLTEAFSSSSDVYSAHVGNDVMAVLIQATPSHSCASAVVTGGGSMLTKQPNNVTVQVSVSLVFY